MTDESSKPWYDSPIVKGSFLTVCASSMFGGIFYGMKLVNWNIGKNGHFLPKKNSTKNTIFISAADKDAKAYQEGLKHEPVTKFARRALYKGTLYAFLGVGTFNAVVLGGGNFKMFQLL